MMLDFDALAHEKINAIGALFSGTLEQKVAVLGAFDTWPFMDFVSNLLAESNYVAVTSRWIYRRIGSQILRFDIREHPDYDSKDFLSTLLDQIISSCKSAVVNFSVSAAHFIETDWCFRKSKRVLGIAYVRSAFEPFESSCEHLELRTTPSGRYSLCTADSQRTAWHCMREAGFCPFNRQDISKNVVEYFFRSPQMKLVAIENLAVLPHIIENEFPLMPPTKGRIGTGMSSILESHESLFRKNPIFVVLLVNHLLKGKMFDRASKLKLLALAQTMTGVDINRIRQSREIKSTDYMKNIKKGYVDLQNVRENCGQEWFDQCISELFRAGLLEQTELDYISGQVAQFIRLSNNGKDFVKFLNNQLSSR
ncbi:hypothetical protein MUP77_16630 [Candidatus Bathyarchaeota archaeon]|nr:hypothetical protein [Candidatus Bathyarchaeota archaeon]